MRTLPALALAALLAIGLTGCSVSVTDAETPSDDTATAPPASQPTAGDDAAAESGSETEPAREAGEPSSPEDEEPQSAESDGGRSGGGDSWSEEEADYRDDMLDAVSRTLTCDGEVTFTADDAGTVAKVDGPCDRVVVDMFAGVVIAGEVGEIEVNGSGNVIYLDSVDVITAAGDANSVSWLGDTPEVNDSGAGNVIISGS